jgi:hypothetical protein
MSDGSPAPRPARAYVAAGLLGASAVLWPIGVALVAAGQHPPAFVVLSLSATATASGVGLASAYSIGRSSAAAMAELTTKTDQLAEQVKSVDHWKIYTDVAADLLGQNDRR